jgi:hypothetical protein
MRNLVLSVTVLCGVVACSKEGEKKAAPEPAAAPVAAPAPAAPAAPQVRPEEVDPCAVFPKEDAEALMGGPVDPPVSQNHSEGSILSCSYAQAVKVDPKADKKKKEKKDKKGVRQPGVEDAVPVLTYTAQAAKRTRTKDAAEAVQRMQSSGATITTEATDVGGSPAIWVKEASMLFTDKNGWIVNTSSTIKGDRLAASKALMEKILPRLQPAPE